MLYYNHNKIRRQNELLVLWTSGVAKSKIANLFFLISIFIFYYFILVFSTIITPTALINPEVLIKQSGVDTVINLIKPNVFLILLKD